MTALRRFSIGRKLKKLDETIRLFEGMHQYPREIFLENRMLQAAAERFFILAIEIVTDIGEHLLAEQAKVTVESYKDVILQLGKQGLIPLDVSKRNAHMTGFRNLLVHAYEDVDAKLVYEYLLSAPKEFRAFAKAFSKFL